MQSQKRQVRTARARDMIQSFGLPFEPLAELVRAWLVPWIAPPACCCCCRRCHWSRQERSLQLLGSA